MTSRADEIIEAVLLLYDLGKTPEFIGNQLGISPAAASGIIKTGQIPATQQTLFDASNEPQKTKPVSRWEGVNRACRK